LKRLKAKVESAKVEPAKALPIKAQPTKVEPSKPDIKVSAATPAAAPQEIKKPPM